MAQGKIKVDSENIFPIIKKFLYSDHEIFLRELVSNAVDATQKLKTLSSLGEVKGDLGEITIDVKVDKKKKTITVSDRGIGMSEEEVKKYINQIAFSGAEEFVEKYKDKAGNIIGHFGLGFYSSFMVAEKVVIESKSHSGEAAVNWECDGSPNFKTKASDKKERGTDVILHVADDSKEFLEDGRLEGILKKYCKFMQVPIRFGTKDEYKQVPTGKKDKDGKKETKSEKFTVDNIINNTEPAWTKNPSTLKDEDYKAFYRELYPMNFEDPLFHIHLNVDYPFNLTGILYFPKLKNTLEVQKDRIQLYCNQVFVTDSVEGIVPDFLTLLKGVLDSPEIPLNVSRSYLQSDSNVKKISNHIMKKVADKLEEMFKENREDFQKKWDDIRIFMEYGILSEDKFYERADKFTLYKTTDDRYLTFEELTKEIENKQKDKNKNLVYLYATDTEAQHAFIESAKERGYTVIVLNSPLTGHFIQKLEQKHEKSRFTRVDAETIDKLIEKDEKIPSKLSANDEEKIKPVFQSAFPGDSYSVIFESMNESDQPVTITRPEYMRRMKDMSGIGGGGGMFMGSMPDMYNAVVNSNHPLVSAILNEGSEERKKEMAKQAADLALLSQGLLKGSALTEFIRRSVQLIK